LVLLGDDDPDLGRKEHLAAALFGEPGEAEVLPRDEATVSRPDGAGTLRRTGEPTASGGNDAAGVRECGGTPGPEQ
jgi:hypothetical protein